MNRRIHELRSSTACEIQDCIAISAASRPRVAALSQELQHKDSQKAYFSSRSFFVSTAYAHASVIRIQYRQLAVAVGNSGCAVEAATVEWQAVHMLSQQLLW
jgi:hypothetical protein